MMIHSKPLGVGGNTPPRHPLTSVRMMSRSSRFRPMTEENDRRGPMAKMTLLDFGLLLVVVFSL